MRYIEVSDAIETAWMILTGLGYRYEENSQLAKDVRTVFEEDFETIAGVLAEILG